MHNRALVIGCANGVWEEVEAAKKLYEFDCTIVVNAAAVEYSGNIDHWVSFHVDLFPHWNELRVKSGKPRLSSLWTCQYRGVPVGRRTPFPVNYIPCEGGSSGLVATLVALKLAHSAVLTGIPMDPERAHYDKPGSWDEALKHRKAWEAYLPQLKGRVISMSGWTKELLNNA